MVFFVFPGGKQTISELARFGSFINAIETIVALERDVKYGVGRQDCYKKACYGSVGRHDDARK